VLRALGRRGRAAASRGIHPRRLTPYNIFVTALEPPQFVFIDHERTGARF